MQSPNAVYIGWLGDRVAALWWVVVAVVSVYFAIQAARRVV